MNTIILGQERADRTATIKKELENIPYKKIIFDFKNEYDDVTCNKFYLNDISLSLSTLGMQELKTLNAGYLDDGSRLLYTYGRIILDEHKNNHPELKGKKLEELPTYFQDYIIEETLDRMHSEWNETVLEYAGILTSKIPLKKTDNSVSLQEAVDYILSEDTVVIKWKNLNSHHARALIFTLMEMISRTTTEKVCFIGDDLFSLSLLNGGNMKFFLDSFSFRENEFLFSFNKASLIPNKILEQTSDFYVHFFEEKNKNEMKEFAKLGFDFKKYKKMPHKLKSDENMHFTHEERLLEIERAEKERLEKEREKKEKEKMKKERVTGVRK